MKNKEDREFILLVADDDDVRAVDGRVPVAVAAAPVGADLGAAQAHGSALLAHDEVCFSNVLAGACLLLALRGKLSEISVVIGHKRGRVTSIVEVVSSHPFLSLLLLSQLPW